MNVENKFSFYLQNVGKELLAFPDAHNIHAKIKAATTAKICVILVYSSISSTAIPANISINSVMPYIRVAMKCSFHAPQNPRNDTIKQTTDQIIPPSL